MFRKSALFLFSILIFSQFGCVENSTESAWKTVVFKEQNYSVECPQKQTSSDYISVRFEEKSQSGYLHCKIDGVEFFIHNIEWNVAENEAENSQRFFDSLGVYGVSANQLVELKYKGKKAIQDVNSEFQSISQHFIVGKTAYHLDVSFPDKKNVGVSEWKIG